MAIGTQKRILKALAAKKVEVVGLIIESQCKNDTEAPIHTAYNKFIARRIIARREIECAPAEYNLGGTCCKKCERGSVKNIPCPTNITKHCDKCKEEEYIDHTNDLDKCLRCSSCDNVFAWEHLESNVAPLLCLPLQYLSLLPKETELILGLETAKKCTPEQNTECTCAKNYFCNSSASCAHCEPCTICESGLVEKQCTSASDTVCKMKGNGSLLWITGVVLGFVLLVLSGGIFWYKRKYKDPTSKQSPGEAVPKPGVHSEMVPLIFADIDLSTHIPGIVGEMTLQDVKTFVRNHRVPEPVIDQILRDNFSDTSEQKIKLFQAWYQRHGIKGAYGTLINSLRELKICTAADKIEEKLKAAVPSSQEGGQSYNDNIEQSTTCTQEGGNSYLDNAELSKTYSDSLEET
ncbi:tumor necrosis factor receptor superfamily member 6 [Apteryx rowi]|uniref:tumor necrosis factor receptor superfamily member 6 n=1 Tax=Apteryx rowi TaxID=308060 RepID=UPI000E1C5FDD|nr:tumor necrosis factor receptor superfamily member 6 [Apteryx rowi]